jgi:hypothetical protein
MIRVVAVLGESVEQIMESVNDSPLIRAKLRLTMWEKWSEPRRMESISELLILGSTRAERGCQRFNILKMLPHERQHHRQVFNESPHQWQD